MKVVIVIMIGGLLKMRGERRKLVERSKKNKKVRPVRREDRYIDTRIGTVSTKELSLYRSLPNIRTGANILARRTIIHVAIDGLNTGRPTTYRRDGLLNTPCLIAHTPLMIAYLYPSS